METCSYGRSTQTCHTCKSWRESGAQVHVLAQIIVISSPVCLSACATENSLLKWTGPLLVWAQLIYYVNTLEQARPQSSVWIFLFFYFLNNDQIFSVQREEVNHGALVFFAGGRGTDLTAGLNYRRRHNCWRTSRRARACVRSPRYDWSYPLLMMSWWDQSSHISPVFWLLKLIMPLWHTNRHVMNI